MFLSPGKLGQKCWNSAELSNGVMSFSLRAGWGMRPLEQSPPPLPLPPYQGYHLTRTQGCCNHLTPSFSRPLTYTHRVLGIFFSRANWGHPNPSPAGECVPSPFGSGEGGRLTHSLAGEGVVGSQFGRWDRHCGTLGIYVLCSYTYCIVHYLFEIQ